MKNLLIMGLASLLLFSLAAGLSLWLQQSKTAIEAPKDEEKKKAGKDKEKPESGEKDKPAKEKFESPDSITARERDLAFEKRQARIELVLADMRSEREAFEKLSKKVVDETKLVIAEAQDAEQRNGELTKTSPKPGDLTKKPLPGSDPAEQKNIDKLAAMYDAMAPEAAAKLIQEMSNGGTMDTAVRIMAKMKDAKAAKVFEAMTDTSLAAQIVNKIQAMRKAPPPIPPGP